ncbi:MAG TPA: CDP-diacylglycerol--serine O-phosphatidyltransferase [Candidatus Baltobacteraceae bacterium]|jgi:CDP-diacylglycerol--serine O-phosphatidyltransferase|nr:CDP-diacylglycerol--serine O-phosphatidyltransferase [Candidatus Baltobacteraceae bacterium]
MERETEKPAPALQIYFLPNLMTAGNLFCGFVALSKIVEAKIGQGDIKIALAFILLACIFDLLDGRLARMGGVESAFGREFDSLADLISFGAAPAFLIHRVVLRQVFSNHPEIGWFVASIYLICGALRLARFNCLAAMEGGGGGKEFLGFPIPAAAGLVASLTLFLLWGDQTDRDLAHPPWSLILPGLLLFLSVMMVSEVKYPSFKTLDLRAKRTFAKTIVAIIFAAALVILRGLILPIVLPIIFTLYLLYGFIRPRISRKVRKGIEEEEDEETGLTL